MSLKPGSIILPTSDHSTFPLIYLQTIEGLRPDVIIGDKYGYIEDSIFRRIFRGGRSPTHSPPLGAVEPSVKERYLVEESGRPVYFTTKSRLPGLETHELVTWGLIYEAQKKGEKPDEAAHEALWKGFRFHAGSIERAPGDFAADLVLADYHFARARRELLFSRHKEALDALQAAKRHGFGIKAILNNLGGTLAEAGKLDEAIQFFKDALDLDPRYDLALRNISAALFSSKRYREGLKWFDRALEIDPSNPVAQLGKARAHKELGERANAYFTYLHLWQADPWDETIRKELEDFAKAAYGEKSTLAKITPPPRPRPQAADSFEDFPSTADPAPAEPFLLGSGPPGAAWVPPGSAVQVPGPR